METLQKQEENSYNNELSYQDENWKVATAHKRRKIILNTSAIKIPDTEMHQQLGYPTPKFFQLTDKRRRYEFTGRNDNTYR